MSRLSVPNQRSNMPLSRTARSISRPGGGSPVRVDLPGGSGAADPLAPMTPWGVNPAPASIPDPFAVREIDAPIPLSDLVDKAGAQLSTLRRTLDDAAASDRVVRAHISDLAQRLQQGQRFAMEFDQRLVNAGRAAGVLEKAATTLRGLEELVGQIRNAHAAMEQKFTQKLAEHEQSIRERLDAMERKYASMTERLDSAAEQARLHASEKIDELGRGVKQDLDALTAHVDRHAAQTQARVSIILDSASDRLEMMSRQAENLGGRTAKEVEVLCEKAARVLGHDPRNPSILGDEPTPAAGSLAHAVMQAREIMDEANQASVRIAAGRSAAEEMVATLEQTRAGAETILASGAARQENLRQSIENALEQAAAAESALQNALARQAAAVAASQQNSALLSRQREDLGAIAEAGRYHVEQARGAELSLRTEMEAAAVRSASLQRALNEVNDQAANLVALAREMANLIQKAQDAKTGLTAAGVSPSGQARPE